MTPQDQAGHIPELEREQFDYVTRINHIAEESLGRIFGEADKAKVQAIIDEAVKAAREQPETDIDGGPIFYCEDCEQRLTLVRPGKHQCDNKNCVSNQPVATREGGNFPLSREDAPPAASPELADKERARIRGDRQWATSYFASSVLAPEARGIIVKMRDDVNAAEDSLTAARAEVAELRSEAEREVGRAKNAHEQWMKMDKAWCDVKTELTTARETIARLERERDEANKKINCHIDMALQMKRERDELLKLTGLGELEPLRRAFGLCFEARNAFEKRATIAEATALQMAQATKVAVDKLSTAEATIAGLQEEVAKLKMNQNT